LLYKSLRGRVIFLENNINEKVAIIILNWNSYTDTYECLKSLEDIKKKNFTVFLADNNSQDNSFSMLQKDYQRNVFSIDIVFIQTGANLGFAGGNNVAIKKAYEQGYEYFWLLNNDTIVEANALDPLINYLISNPEVGITGSKIYYYNTSKIWFAGGKVDLSMGRVKHIGLREEDNGLYDTTKQVDFINGCSLAFKREVLDKVGYMNEDYFLYYEETDWNTRVRKAGFKIVFCPQSVIYHKVSLSSGGEDNLSSKVYYYNFRNAFIFVFRNNPKSIFKARMYLIYRIFKKLVTLTFKKNYGWKDLIIVSQSYPDAINYMKRNKINQINKN